MKKIFSSLFFIMLFSSLSSAVTISAVEFSPSILVYSVEPNQELCQQITIFSETLKKFDVSDNLSANYQIEINYTKTIARFKGEKIIDVCIKGSQLGTYNGMIFFKDPLEKNINLSVGAVQLLVDVSEIPQSPAETPQENPSTSSGGGSGGGGGGSAAKPKSQLANKTIQSLSAKTTEISNSTNEFPYDSSGITGAAVDTNSKLKSILPIVFILVVVALAVYTKIKSKVIKEK